MLSRMPLLIGQRLLTRTASFQVTKCQFSRLSSESINSALRKGLVFNSYKHSKVYGIYPIRYKSTDNTSIEEILGLTEKTVAQSSNVPETPVVQNVPETPVVANANSTELLNEIPDPPVPIAENAIQQVIELNALGEPTFSSLGLGGYGPIGLLQYYLEWFHLTTNLPWWATVIATSLIIKIAVFPCAISLQKNAARMHSVLPGMVQLQERVTDSRKSGNMEETSLAAYELQDFLRKNKISLFPYANFLRVGIHLPMFMALRGMANLPVESLKTGGLWWFTDLTSTDPYYLLPICTSLTLYIVTEYSMRTSAQTQVPNAYIKYGLRAVPVISFLFSMHFPGIVLCHWATSNLVTIVENRVMKIPAVRKYFNIPLIVPHPKKATKKPEKSFKESFSDSWQSMQITNKLAAQARADMIRFNEAGKGPLTKTYKYNPKAQPASMCSMKK